MVEPSRANPDSNVRLYGSLDGSHWRDLMQWKKDFWPMSLFQYGNAILPDGRNATEFLALTTVAVDARRSQDLDLACPSSERAIVRKTSAIRVFLCPLRPV